MNTYGMLHSDCYDVVYADKPYAEEAEWILARLSDAGWPEEGTLLDLACGSGRHAEVFARRGLQVTGVDINPQLLDLARARAEADGLPIDFRQQDMRALDLPVRFDVATCLFDSIGYPVAVEGVSAALDGLRAHLADGGYLAVEFLHAAPLLRGADPVRVKRFQTPDGTLVRISETHIDAAESVMRVDYDLTELKQDGAYRQGVERQENRFFTITEMDLLLRGAGFDPMEFLPAYSSRSVVDADTWHVAAISRTA